MVIPFHKIDKQLPPDQAEAEKRTVVTDMVGANHRAGDNLKRLMTNPAYRACSHEMDQASNVLERDPATIPGLTAGFVAWVNGWVAQVEAEIQNLDAAIVDNARVTFLLKLNAAARNMRRVVLMIT